MSREKKKGKANRQKWIAFAITVILSFAAGVLIADYLAANITADLTYSVFLITGTAMFISSFFINIIIHEAGHLVFGLLTGYKFSSFRILSFMWVKENGKIRFKRLSLAGTSGQCLMSPPDLVDGKMPCILYNLGGVIMNAAAGVVFLIIHLAVKSILPLSAAMLVFSMFNFILAAVNGIPLKIGVPNDGRNALTMSRNPEACRCLWAQLKINELTARGVRLKDMPAEIFTLPSDEDMNKDMIADLGVFACNRLMDMHKFDEANEAMTHILGLESKICDLHRGLLICDRIYCEAISGNTAGAAVLMTKEQKNFIKSMKSFPSVIRAEYAYALLCECNSSRAQAVEIKFDKIAKSYPYPSDIESERELMQIAYEIYLKGGSK